MFVLASLSHLRKTSRGAVVSRRARPSSATIAAKYNQLVHVQSESGNRRELEGDMNEFEPNISSQKKESGAVGALTAAAGMVCRQHGKMAPDKDSIELADKNGKTNHEEMLEIANTPGKIMTLNVGGTKYATSLSTLTKYPDSMLGVMFSGRHTFLPQDDGSHFIDRDGEAFKYVLIYLRDDRLARALVPKLDSRLRMQLLFDAEYYQLQELATIVRLCQVKANPQGHVMHAIPCRNALEQSFKPLSSALTCQLEYQDKEIVLRNVSKQIHQELTTLHNQRFENVLFPKSVLFSRCDLSGSVFRNCCFEGDVSFEGSILCEVTLEGIAGLSSTHLSPWQVAQANFEQGLLEHMHRKRLIY